MIFLLFFLPFAWSCIVHDETGMSYDLSTLTRFDTWKVKDRNGDSGLFAMYYMFNFCEDVKEKCKGKSASAFEQLEVFGQPTDTCEIMGSKEYSKVTLIDESNPKRGIRLTYNNGEPCVNSESPSENGLPRKVSFKLICSNSVDPNFYQSRVNPPEITKCSMEFKIKTPAGCALGVYSSPGSSFHLLLLLWTIIGVYLGCGYFINSRYRGLDGSDAIPHYEIAKELPIIAIEGLHFFIEKSKETIDYIRERINQSSSKGYNGV